MVRIQELFMKEFLREPSGVPLRLPCKKISLKGSSKLCSYPPPPAYLSGSVTSWINRSIGQQVTQYLHVATQRAFEHATRLHACDVQLQQSGKTNEQNKEGQEEAGMQIWSETQIFYWMFSAIKWAQLLHKHERSLKLYFHIKIFDEYKKIFPSRCKAVCCTVNAMKTVHCNP